MVQINPEDSKKLQFRKLLDPEDSLLTSFYKHWFRYASPNLFIWGPLAPAHDAILARTSLARIQCTLSLIILYGAFRRYPANIGKFRRRFTRTTNFIAGSALLITGLREITYFDDPNSNPLYVEIQLARELSLLDPNNNGKPNKGSYWFGPKNFMPMNNEQYWKMVYAMEVNEIMADQYLESPLMAKCKSLLDKNYGADSTVHLKSDELTSRIEDIVNRSGEPDQLMHHSSLINNKNTNLFPLYEKQDKKSRSKTLHYWTVHNPFDALQLQEYKEFYAYMFPRIPYDDQSTKKK